MTTKMVRVNPKVVEVWERRWMNIRVWERRWMNIRVKCDIVEPIDMYCEK